MISSLTWAQRAHVSNTPLKYVLTEEEFNDILKETKSRTREAKLKGNSVPVEDEDDKLIMEKYNFEDYDDEDKASGSDTNVDADDAMDRVFSNIQDLTVMDDEDFEDIDENQKEEDEDYEDLVIRPTDYLLVATRTPEDDEDVTQLEYYVYEDGQDNLYVHHDIMLPSFALCLEWINNNRNGGNGNMVAVGTFDPEIEIWNLDYMDPVYPEWILGAPESKVKKGSTSPYWHTDAVLSLSWNQNQKQFLVSGSADNTIKLWDLNSSSAIAKEGKQKKGASIHKALRSFDSIHTDKVQTIKWSPHISAPWMIASGSCDHKCCIFDTRQPNSALYHSLSAEVESLLWDPFNENQVIIGDESGLVSWIDTRSLSNRPTENSGLLKQVQMHEKAITCLDASPFVPGLLLTGSLDNYIKLWDYKEMQINCLYKKDFHIGKVFNARFSADSPFLIAMSGSKEDLTVWNLKEAMFESRPSEKLKKSESRKNPSALQDLSFIKEIFQTRLADQDPILS
jgi:periodic tryptophan protein 1